MLLLINVSKNQQKSKQTHNQNINLVFTRNCSSLLIDVFGLLRETREMRQRDQEDAKL